MDWRNKDEVEAWLGSLPREVMLAFAQRTVQRVLPYALGALRQNAELTFVVLRASLISGVAGIWPTTKMSSTTRAVLTTARATTRAPTLATTRAALGATLAVLTTTRAPTLAALAALDATTRAPALATFDTFDTFDTDKAWIEAQSDISTLAFLARPLWEGSEMPEEIAKEWHKFRETAPDDIWGFWKRWYQGILDGKPLDWELQKRVALIDPEIWEQGPEEVAKAIAEIEAAFIPPMPDTAPNLLWQDTQLSYEPTPPGEAALSDAARRTCFARLCDELAGLERFHNQLDQLTTPVNQLKALCAVPFDQADMLGLYFEAEALFDLQSPNRDDSTPLSQETKDSLARVLRRLPPVFVGLPEVEAVAARNQTYLRIKRDMAAIEAEISLSQNLARANFVSEQLKLYFDQLGQAAPDGRVAEHRPSWVRNALIAVVEWIREALSDAAQELVKDEAKRVMQFASSYKDQIIAFFQSAAPEAVQWAQTILQGLG